MPCPPAGQCAEPGSRDLQTGVCSSPLKPDGTDCDDGDACTQVDGCRRGKCEGASPVVCTPLDQCRVAGECDPKTGLCTDPAKADGTVCDDGRPWTLSDSCQGGTCVGGDLSPCPLTECSDASARNPETGLCTPSLKPAGTPCGPACTRGGTCDGNGTCAGTIEAVVCVAIDDCHAVGSCDPTTGECTNPIKSDGAACDDGDACTRVDTCQNGTCVGGEAVVCVPIDQCHRAGACDPATGQCSSPARPDGITCNDGNECTAQDECTAGVCRGQVAEFSGARCELVRLRASDLCGGTPLAKSMRRFLTKRVRSAEKRLEKARKATAAGKRGKMEKQLAKLEKILASVEKKTAKLVKREKLPAVCQESIRGITGELRSFTATLVI